MKKGSILMLAYSSALIVLVIVDTVVKQGITTRISLAAALASYFFAFADMFVITADRTKGAIKTNESRVVLIGDVVLACQEYIANWRKTYSELEQSVEGIANSEIVNGVLNIAVDGRAFLADIEESIIDLQSDSANIEKLVTKQKIRESRYLVLGAILTFVGFVLFFLVAFLDALFNSLESSQSIISVCAFAIVILCYEVKERYKTENEDEQKCVNNAIKRVEQLKNEMKQGKNEIEKYDSVIDSLRNKHR